MRVGDGDGDGEKGGAFTRILKTEPRGLRIGGIMLILGFRASSECGFVDSGVIEIRFSTRIRADDASHRAF